MAPVFKVTGRLVTSVNKTLYVRAECEDYARDIAIEHILDGSLGYFSLVCDNVEVVEDIDESEVLS